MHNIFENKTWCSEHIEMMPSFYMQISQVFIHIYTFYKYKINVYYNHEKKIYTADFSLM